MTLKLLTACCVITVYWLFKTVCLPLEAEARSVPKIEKLLLAPQQCLITNDNEGTISATAGAKIGLDCTLSEKTLSCKTLDIVSVQEDYSIVVSPIESEGELFVAKSKSGNVQILAFLKKNRFSIASSNIIPAKGALLTKHCSGAIERK